MQSVPNVLRVLLRSEFEASSYERRWRDGRAPDRLPYGLENVPEGWTFEIGRRRAASRVGSVGGRGVRRVLGFDLLHAWRNRRFLDDAATVYCHSEVEYLGVAAVLLLLRNRTTRLVGQTIWLFHGFDAMPPWRRRLLRGLLRRVDLFVYNASPNLDIGSALLPAAQHRYVPFGVSSVFLDVPEVEKRWDVLSVGNDVGRDWEVLQGAVEPLDVTTRVATDLHVLDGTSAVVRPTADLTELRELYASSRCVVVAVRPNSHASGITSMLEAAASATAVVATRAGGLDSYFSDDGVRFVPSGSADALRTAIEETLADDRESAERGRRLREQFRTEGYSNADYWRRITGLLDPPREHAAP